MEAVDVARLVGQTISVPPTRLWWQNAGDGLAQLSVHPLVTGGDLSGPYRTDGRPPLDVVDGLRRRLSSAGWGDLPHIFGAVDSVGRIVITDGLHRSAAAFLAEFSSIPCDLVYRSSEWWRLRYALVALNGGTTSLYQPIDHPDLAWPAYRTDTAVRTEAIWSAIRDRAARVTEVACNAGGISIGLARHGIDVLGLDADPRAVEVARQIGTMDGIGSGLGTAHFEVCDAIPEVPDCGAVVCLSLLNHHATDGRTEEGREILRRCVTAAPVVFLDCPASSTGAGAGSDLVDPQAMMEWCRVAGVAGSGEVVAREGNGMQRTLIAWRR